MTADTPLPLYIHEFSTGINPDGTSENWISRGFTGRYMNCTLPEIPYNVERSIANDEFKVAESVDKDTPSMVGRVVLASGGANDWSVVAVITRGKDEYVRSLTVSRYFLAEGADSLPKIVAWINFRAKQGRLPIYNPFELKTVGKPNTGAAPIVKTNIKPDVEAYLRNSSTPLIVSPDSYAFPVLDSLARRKSEITGQPASWAYNVEALEKPERFQIILPASDRALTLIQQALATKPKEQAASAIDEKALKQAIKGLADNPTVKTEQWQTFVENIFVVASALPDPDKASDYWRRLFDGQGASNAIKQGIYTQPMIRLLTIRAIALPDTLPNFLQWLQVVAGKKGKDGSYGETSLEFQGQIASLSQETRLKEFLVEGVRDLVGKVLMQAVSPESAAWLLVSKQSLWYPFRNQLITDFRHDLKVVGNLARGMPSQDRLIISGKFWDKIWHEIQQFWRVSPKSFSEKYAPLAYFFDQLGDSFVSAHFCQLSYGQVPSQLFKQAFPNLKNAGLINSHGLMIRQQGYNERGEPNIVPYPLVAAIAVFMLTFGFVGGFFTKQIVSQFDDKTPDSRGNRAYTTESNAMPTEAETPTTNSTQNVQNIPENTSSPSQAELTNGIGKIAKTKESVTLITRELQKTFPGDAGKIQDLIKLILGNQDLQLGNLNPSKSERDKESWVRAIYSYQVKNTLPKDGVIDTDGRTYDKLKKDISNKLKPSTPLLREP